MDAKLQPADLSRPARDAHHFYDETKPDNELHSLPGFCLHQNRNWFGPERSNSRFCRTQEPSVHLWIIPLEVLRGHLWCDELPLNRII